MQPYGYYNPSINYQQNQSMVPHQSNHDNGHNMQQFPNNDMNYYCNSTPTTCQLPNNNGFLIPTNVPDVSPNINTFNASFSNNGNIPQSMQPTFQPTTLSYSYNNVFSPNPNVNVNNSTSFNMQMSSNINACYQGKQFTHNMPSQFNPSNVQYGPQVSGSNNQYESNSKKDDEWFNLTSTFLNNTSNNLTHDTSSVPNTDSKQKYSLKNQSINTINPKTIATKSFGTQKKSDKLNIDQIIANEQKKHYHSFESDLYNKKHENSIFMPLEVCNEFKIVLGNRATDVNALKPVYNKDGKSKFKVNNKCKVSKGQNCDKTDSGSSDEDSDYENEKSKELVTKCAHFNRLHSDIMYNELKELNDGPVCRCSSDLQRPGIRDNVYVGEVPFKPCLPSKNNADKLYHYRITITPLTNYLHEYPTIIKYKRNKYTFEGFSLLSHYPIPTMPKCTFTRFNINYTIIYIEEKIPDNFIIQELKLFYDFFFKDILELVDFDLHAINNKDGCPQFHFMPRFVRDISNNNKVLLSMSNVLKYLLNSNKLLFEENSLPALKKMSRDEWQDIICEYKGTIITNPETKPSSIRVDYLDRKNKENITDKRDKLYPVVVHFGKITPKLCYSNSELHKYTKDYETFKNLIVNANNPSPDDLKQLEIMKRALKVMNSNDKMKVSVTTTFSSKGFYKTGLMCDVAQHAILLPVLVSHFRFYKSLEYLEKSIGYKFKDKSLFKLALTHSSYGPLSSFGTNPHHVKNILTNCCIQRPEYGERRNCIKLKERCKSHLINTSRFDEVEEIKSHLENNERLEFLGDSVIKFLSSLHLVNIFPDLEDGGLAAYRTALVENEHLTFLARNLKFEDFILCSHHVDLCCCFRPKILANCCEAVIAAIFLDGGIEAADCVFGKMLFKDSSEHLKIWVNYPKHPLQQQEPKGVREYIEISPFIKKLTRFEESIGVKFNHIRLLAGAFIHKSTGFTNLTLGSNQSLAFLGESFLQFTISSYLYNKYPSYHEGILTDLRSYLLKKQMESDVCCDLGIANYAVHSKKNTQFQIRDKASFVEALIGALYLDKGPKFCSEFCKVCFFPRLPKTIIKPYWTDPTSKLLLCLKPLQSFPSENSEKPIYKVIETTGPGHCLKFTIGVYFKGVLLSMGKGQSKHMAKMNAANSAMELCKDLFPQLIHEKKTILRLLHRNSINGNLNYMAIREMVETYTSINDSSLSKSEKQINEIKYKLLIVLCTGKDYIEEDTEAKDDKKHIKEEDNEPERKKLKQESEREKLQVNTQKK